MPRQKSINDIIAQRRSITQEFARRMQTLYNTNPREYSRLQRRYDKMNDITGRYGRNIAKAYGVQWMEANRGKKISQRIYALGQSNG